MTATAPRQQLLGSATATTTRARQTAADTAATPAIRAGGAESLLAQIVEVAPASALASDCLCFEDGFGGFVIVPINRPAMRIGRALAADIPFEDPTVSRRHALLTLDRGRVRLLDDRSLNGVFVNGARVRSRVLVDGDVIGVGRHRLHFAQRPTPARSEDSGALALAAA